MFLQKELRHILEHANFQSQKAALRVLSKYNAPEALRNILFAITNDNPDLKLQGWHMLDRWINNYRDKLWFPFDKNIYMEVISYMHKANLKINEYTYKYYNLESVQNILDIVGKNNK